MTLIGDVYCREFPEKLEAFINKYHSIIPASFVNMMGKYRRWKEAFKLLLLRSNLDEALELVIRHPSIEFDHLKLTAVLSKIKNQKVLENLLHYYFEYDPRMILGLQDEFIERLDMGSLINFFKQRKVLFVIDKTMRRYQAQNPGNVVASMGLNEHLVQINDYYGLIDSKNVHQLTQQKYQKLCDRLSSATSEFLPLNLWLILGNLLKLFLFLSKRMP